MMRSVLCNIQRASNYHVTPFIKPFIKTNFKTPLWQTISSFTDITTISQSKKKRSR